MSAMGQKSCVGGRVMDDKEIGLEVWKATIEVQKHFNEIGIKIRSIAVTVLAAFLAVAGYAFKEGNEPLAGVILYASLACWIAFYLMDRVWYHRLLQEAVSHGERVEAELKPSIPNIDLTTRIRAASPVWGLSAGWRLSFFYLIIGAILAITGSLLLNAS